VHQAGLLARFGPERIVVVPRQTGPTVGQDEGGRAVGMGGGEEQGGGSGVGGSEEHGPLRADRVHHGAGLVCPPLPCGEELGRHRIGSPGAPPVEHDDPAERAKPSEERRVGRILPAGIDAVAGEGCPDQIRRALAEGLVCDPVVAERGELGVRDLLHGQSLPKSRPECRPRRGGQPTRRSGRQLCRSNGPQSAGWSSRTRAASSTASGVTQATGRRHSTSGSLSGPRRFTSDEDPGPRVGRTGRVRTRRDRPVRRGWRRSSP
jgi:hypothetical protein